MSPSVRARLVGALVLSLVVLGPIALVIVPGQIVVSGDAAATRAALIAQPGLFGLGLTAEAGIVLVEIAVTALLWGLFRPVSPILTDVAALARAVMTAMQGVGLLLGIALATQASTLSVEAVDLLLSLRHANILAWQVPFGLHLILLGVLVTRSGLAPRWFGPTVALAGLAYLQHTAVMVLAPDLGGTAEALVAVTALLGEVPLFVWMLARGVRATHELDAASPGTAPALRPATR